MSAKAWTRAKWLVLVLTWLVADLLTPNSGWRTEGAIWIAFFGGALYSTFVANAYDAKKRLTVSQHNNLKLGTFSAEATYEGRTIKFDSQDDFNTWMANKGFRKLIDE